MVTYGDYFSRRVLNYCGVSPNKTLLNKEENAYKDGGIFHRVFS